MISKRIQPSFWFNDEPIASLLNVHSRGLDKQHMDKFASQRSPLADLNIRPEKGFAFVHVITTGAGERYGCNNNADFFNKEAREWVFPYPISKTRKSTMLRGGLKDYHNTFTKYAAVYKEHFNSKKGGTPLGDIYKEAYNDHMDRGELIVKLPLEKWAAELDNLERDKPFFLSMGCGVPYDICSGCGNQAPTRNQYCTHLRYQKMAMDKEGNMIFAINDQPHFHDISGVVKPADRIAFSLAKVASEGHGDVFEEDISGLYIPHHVIHKLASVEEKKRLDILDKLSAIEKRVLAEGLLLDEEGLADGFDQVSEEKEADIIQKLAGFSSDQVFFHTHREKILLPPRVFASIVMRKTASAIPGINGIERALPTLFSELKEAGDLEVLEDGSYNGTRSYGRGPELAAHSLADSLSLKDEPMRTRIIRNSIRGHEKTAALASQDISEETRVLAKEYAKYQLSFLSGADDRFVQRVAVHNLTQA
jgi:hypothetical protein